MLLGSAVFVAALLTWVLPAGEYDRKDDPVTGRSVVVRLFRARVCNDGQREFTRFTFTFAGGAHGATFKSPFYSGTGCP